MQEERECEWLKYYIFVYNPMNSKNTSIRWCIPVSILHTQTPLYLFYQLILQLILHTSSYFNIQPNKII